MSDARWYLIHSKARQEVVAELNLRQLGIHTFCPRVKTAQLPHNKAQSEEILFPGYLFIKADMTNAYRKVTYAHGVLRVVKFGSEPAVVDDEIIDSIQKRVHKGLVVRPVQSSLKMGQIVRINKGPFYGFEAVFEGDLNGAQRVALLMKTVAFQGHMVIDRNCVGLL